MKINPDDTVFPIPGNGIRFKGLTKREYFAAMAMSGICTKAGYSPEDVAMYAINCADKLIAFLENTES